MDTMDALTERWFHRLRICVLLPWWLVAGLEAATQYVIVISVDGMGSAYVTPLLASGVTNELTTFKRFQSEGAGTLNARSDPDNTTTLPNHVTMMTGRGVNGTAGHGWSENEDPLPTETLASNKGSYVASAFDVAHDNGRRTGIWAGKSKFSLFLQSYSSTTGAVDITGPDNGRDKIDYDNVDDEISSLSRTEDLMSQMAANPFHFVFFHYPDPDDTGHEFGWSTNPASTFAATLKMVDTQIGNILQMVEENPTLQGKTTIILTADHGGHYYLHDDTSDALNFTIPFYVWGPGVLAGGDLYAMNPTTRTAPGEMVNPAYTGSQPIRNGDAANLAMHLLGLGAVPESTIDNNQDLIVTLLTGFALWIQGFSWNAYANPDKTPTGDPDGDGFENAIEYILGSSPAAANAGGPTVSIIGDDFVFMFQRALASKTADAALAIEVGTTLAAWPGIYQVGTDTPSSTPGVTVAPGPTGYELITLTIPRAPDARKFARMRVSITP